MIDEPLDWNREGRDWPLRDRSLFVATSDLRWHVQRAEGVGPAILLLHGTGASAHSWHALFERLEGDFELIAPDLPGHGFSGSPAADGFTLPGMSHRIAELLGVLGVAPRIVVGHSAGAAILFQMCLDGALDPEGLVSVNGALLPFRGRLNGLYAGAARALAATPIPARLVARRAREAETIAMMLLESGSRLAPQEVEWYVRLASNACHVRSALRMMGGWDLASLSRALPRLETPVTLVSGDRDRFVAPRTAAEVARRLQSSTQVAVSRAGHLAHEERPEEIERLIRRLAADSDAMETRT